MDDDWNVKDTDKSKLRTRGVSPSLISADAADFSDVTLDSEDESDFEA